MKMSISSIIFLSFLLIACDSTDSQKASLQPTAKAADPGQAIVKKNCKVCHAQGINGAPIIGNKKMWGPRLGKGEAALTENAINGYGLMPAKGGKTQLSDHEIKLSTVSLYCAVDSVVDSSACREY